MARFIFAYHGGKRPESEEEYKRVMAAWNAFYEKMGERVVEGGGPAGSSRTVSRDGVSDNGGANPVSGFTVVEADSLEAAVEMARDCPMVSEGSGSVEVAEIMRM